MSSRMGLSSARARAKASSPHSYQSTSWCTAERRYGLAARVRRPWDFSFTLFLPDAQEAAARAVFFVIGSGAQDRYLRDRSACVRKNLHPGGDKNECGLRPAASTGRPLPL